MFKIFKLAARVSELEEAQRKLKLRVDDVELEWSSYLDKFKRIMHRIAKRADVVENAERQPEGDVVAAAGDATPSLSPTWSRLTPRQKQVQMQILQRRASAGGP